MVKDTALISWKNQQRLVGGTSQGPPKTIISICTNHAEAIPEKNKTIGRNSRTLIISHPDFSKCRGCFGNHNWSFFSIN